ncbi:hypothetical protein AAZX31_06G224500 [Glycine max]
MSAGLKWTRIGMTSVKLEFPTPALSAPLTLLVVQILSRKLNKRHNRKKYHPVAADTIFNQMPNFNRLHHYMTDLAAKHRAYRLLNLFRYEVYTTEPTNVEYILKTNFENYGKLAGPERERQLSDTDVQSAVWEVCGDSGALQLLFDLLHVK